MRYLQQAIKTYTSNKVISKEILSARNYIFVFLLYQINMKENANKNEVPF